MSPVSFQKCSTPITRVLKSESEPQRHARLHCDLVGAVRQPVVSERAFGRGHEPEAFPRARAPPASAEAGITRQPCELLRTTGMPPSQRIQRPNTAA